MGKRMKLLHTSDWHLGKRLMEAERLREQIDALDELVDFCEREQVELVLVAGDIFDTYLPSAEAEEVFFVAVKRLAGSSRAVVLVSGNHDDGIRLAASAPVCAEEGVYIFGNRPVVFPVGGNRPVKPVLSGERYLVFENGKGEQVYINALPYPNESRMREEKTDESYPERVARWINKGNEGYDGKMPYVLLTHLFVLGGVPSEGERGIDLGGARVVPPEALPDWGYTALGHLHKKQRVGENAYYSGSLLQYSFDEANIAKCAMLLEARDGRVTLLREIPLTSGKKLVRLETRGVAEAVKLLKNYENALIELTLHLTAPLTARETRELHEANDGLVSLVAKVKADETQETPMRSNLSPEELFCQFYASKFGEEAPAELKTAFLALLEEEA